MKSIAIKILALVLAMLMVFSVLTACTTPKESDKDDDEIEDNVDENEDDEDEDEDKEDEDEESESEDEESDTESESDSDSAFEDESDDTSDTESDTETESESESAEAELTDAIRVFANGEYSALFIKTDSSSSFDNGIYNQVRDLFKEKTTKKPSMDTDFTPKGEEKSDGPAILVGDTNYPETETVKKTLKDGQAIAKLVGNKFVIVYASSEAADKLLSKLKTTLNNKATATEIIID